MGQRSGTTTPQQQPPKIRKDDAGVSVEIPYESTDYNTLYAILPTLEAAGNPAAFDYESGFGKAKLNIKYPYDFVNSTAQSYVQSLWEFFAQKVEKDLLTVNLPIGPFVSFGSSVPGIGIISQNDAFLVRMAQQLSQQGFIIGLGWFSAPTDANGNGLTYTPVAGMPAVAVPAAVNPRGCFSVLTLILRGQSSAPVFAPTLRFTQTVSSQYAIQASLLNAGNIISTASMSMLNSIPSGLLFSLPNNANPPNQYLNISGDLVWGWFKDFPTVRQIARLKWNIVQEWQYGLYPVAVYGQLL